MHIILVTMNFPPQAGGISVYCSELAEYLRQAGCKVSVVWIRKSRWLRYAIGFIRLLWKCLLPGSDHIISLGWYPCGAVSWVTGKLTGVPYSVISFDSELYYSDPVRLRGLKLWLRKTFKQPVFKDAQCHFAISRYTAGLLQTVSGLDHSCISVLTPGVDTGFFCPGEPDKAVLEKCGVFNRPYLLSVGRLVPNKGYDAVIRILHELAALIPELVYCIVGNGPDRKRLQALAREGNVSSSVVFTGTVSRNELKSLYQGCVCGVVPSRPDPEFGIQEGFGLVALEANACGTIAIGSDMGGIPDAIENGQTGYLFDVHSKTGLLDTIKTVLQDRSQLAKMKKKARIRAVDHDWSKIARTLLNCIREKQR